MEARFGLEMIAYEHPLCFWSPERALHLAARRIRVIAAQRMVAGIRIRRRYRTDIAHLLIQHDYIAGQVSLSSIVNLKTLERGPTRVIRAGFAASVRSVSPSPEEALTVSAARADDGTNQ